MLRIAARKARGKKQAGFVVTAELLLITTILVLGLITGWTKVRDQTLAELSDNGAAIGAINQSYTMKGTTWFDNGTGVVVASVSGFAFTDALDGTFAGSVGGDGQEIHYNAAPIASMSTAGVGEEGIK